MKLLVSILSFVYAADFPYIECPGKSEHGIGAIETFCGNSCSTNWQDVSVRRKEQLLSQWEEMCSQLGIPRYQHDRNIADHLLGANMAIFRGYGCWCNLNSLFRAGHGQPQDDVDENCRKLHLGYDCIKMDATDDGTTCDTRDDNYLVIPAMNYSIIELQCRMISEMLYGPTGENLPQAKIDCAIRLCAVESRFLSWFLIDAMNSSSLDDSYIHDTYGGSFNFDDNCHNRPGEREMGCCGIYPFRFPYNVATQECCDTGLTGSDQFDTVSYGTC